MTMQSILGWDVGGANLKAARLDGGESDARVLERSFALWREPARLPEMLAGIAEELGGPADHMAVTMTAELADCFATRREGVMAVLDAFRRAFPRNDPYVYGVDGRFRSVSAARERPMRVAAANWRASATLVARTIPDAIFLDVGSTTTDVIPIVGGVVKTRGKSDPGRLRSGELVYTGLLRTPVCAMVRWLPLRGRRCRVAAELFAISADVHRWLGRIDDDGYACETPDGRGRGRMESAARLARMVGADLDMLVAADVTAIAEHAAWAQMKQIARAIRQVRERLGVEAPRLAVVAGHGTAIARDAAQMAGLDVRDLRDDLGPAAARSAPAAAVAYLLASTIAHA